MLIEEFQSKVFDELEVIKNGIKEISDAQEVLAVLQNSLEKKLDFLYDKTASLANTKVEIGMKLETIIEDSKSIHEMIGEHEISIRTLRRKAMQNR